MAEQPLGPIGALNLALKLEAEAAEFYKRHAAQESVTREIFQFFVNEEVKHRQPIEKKIAELTRV